VRRFNAQTEGGAKEKKRRAKEKKRRAKERKKRKNEINEIKEV